MAKYAKMAEIATEHKNKDYDYDCIGIRAQEVPASVGEIIDHCSLIWDDGEQTDEELIGVCAIDINQCVSRNSNKYLSYPGEYVLVLGCNRADGGEDIGEIIMVNPVVLAVYHV